MRAIQRVLALLAVGCYVAMAQESATVRTPGVVKAGEYLNFEISVDTAPNVDGSAILYWIKGPGSFDLQSSCSLEKGKKTCNFGIKIPYDTPSGTGYLTQLYFMNGTRRFELPIEKVPFQVVARTEPLIFPSHAEVTVKPSQVQLLRGEVSRLQQELQSLKTSVAGDRQRLNHADIGVVRAKLENELKSLSSTESRFRELADETQSQTIHVFFDDLRTSYTEVLTGLGDRKGQVAPDGDLVQTSWSPSQQRSSKGAGARYSLEAQAVFLPFELNELAYTLVADTGALTFNLEVNSDPQGATISYGRRGDAVYKMHPAETNSTLKALPLAIWSVRFQKQGFRDKEIEFNPFIEPNRVITVSLGK